MPLSDYLLAELVKMFNKFKLGIILKLSVRHKSLFFFFSTFIYFWDRERQSMNGGGAEREGDTESETGSRL